MTVSFRVLLHANEAAESLCISPRRLAELRRGGAIRAVKDGGKWKYRPTDLEAYAEALLTNIC
jgi:excisionase family DNA binding protein